MSDPEDKSETKDGADSDDDVAPGEMTLGEELTTIIDDLTGESDDEDGSGEESGSSDE